MNAPSRLPASGPPSAADLAKAALRRLAMEHLEPTPDNYARAYASEAGQAAPPPPGTDAAPTVPLADWIERVVRGLERGGRQWTAARKKDSLQRVLSGSRADVVKLQQRLGQLLAGWERDTPDSSLAELDALEAPAPAEAPAFDRVADLPLQDLALAAEAPSEVDAPPDVEAAWPPLVERLGQSVRVALPAGEDAALALATELGALTARLGRDGAGAAEAAALAEVCDRADLLLQHRHHLMALLTALCEDLSGSLTDLAENDSWARGQCDAMRLKIEDSSVMSSLSSCCRVPTQMTCVLSVFSCNRSLPNQDSIRPKRLPNC